MYTLHFDLSRERQQHYLREAADHRLGDQLATQQRWKRRAEKARRRANRFERRIEHSGRSEFDLAGH